MPSELKGYRVFIASPGGLESERVAFYSVVRQYNIDEATHRGVQFEPIGWEQVTPGMGRPQTLIDEELKKSDFFILLLHDRWGSHPGENKHGASSGTEEEYYVALDCYHDRKLPMQDIACFFKSVSPEQLSEPDEELRKVLNFKMNLESDKKQLFGTFSSTQEFEILLRSALAKWLRGITDRGRSRVVAPTPDNPGDLPTILGIILTEGKDIDKISKQHIQEAWSLVHKGRITEAEIEFSKAIKITPKAFLLLSYSKFLIEYFQLMTEMNLKDHYLKVSIT
jgi:hypothetical protein